MLRFHHSGFIVADIDLWEKKIFFETKTADVVDPVQQARLTLYKNFSEDSFIELIQPLNETAFTWKALQKNGNHFNHFCYTADSLEEINELALQHKFIPVLGPVKALLFDNQEVLFFYMRNKQIIEFLITNNESQNNH